ncbi:MAG TPA: hypothetical protein VGC96_11115 [Candidatus Elarobacter sp.]|jgi:hypothetical protein
MSRLSHLAAGAVVALALAAQAGAEPVAGPPTAAILRIEGGFAPHERWVWYDADGTARLRGLLLLGEGRGRFTSHADFKAVRAVLDDAHACAPRPGVSRPMVGNDMLYYRVDVRCGKTWRVMRDWVRPPADVSDTPDMWKIVHGLEGLAGRLTWSPSDEEVPLPEPGPMFRSASPAR